METTTKKDFPTWATDTDENGKKTQFSQLLRIEINASADCIDGRQSPEIADMLRELADHFETVGVQLTKYPFEHAFGDEVLMRVDLVEAEEEL